MDIDEAKVRDPYCDCTALCQPFVALLRITNIISAVPFRFDFLARDHGIIQPACTEDLSLVLSKQQTNKQINKMGLFWVM
uniref:Uncharacterized protein n=1 Tax=Physcomitrium patens TaxID=3218 RepID=A0A2K1L476_PHYPA|nr:hypothetical protein PHYPA_003620 [Physcomitrium patens]